MISRSLLALLGGREAEPDGLANPLLHRSLDERVLLTLRPLAGILSLLFGAFMVADLLALPPSSRGLGAASDLALVVGCGALYLGMVRSGLPTHLAHPTAAVVFLAVAIDLVGMMAAHRSGFHTVYLDIALIGAGSTLLIGRAWTVVALTTWAMWLPVAVQTVDEPRDIGLFAFTLFASTAVSLAIMSGRIRNECALHELRRRDAEQTRALEAAHIHGKPAQGAEGDPLEEATPEPRDASPGDAQAVDGPVNTSQPHRDVTILMVEDDSTVRRVGRRVLARHGYEVLTAANGLQALELLAAHPVDLLWTDVLMPGMSGLELVRKVHAEQPELKLLLSSGYTGRAFDPSREQLPESCRFLSKPYSTRDLKTAVASILAE